MKSPKAKREAELAAEALHGKPLLLILAALRGQLAAKKQELAREKNEGRRKSIEKEAAAIQGLIDLRKAELDSAIEAAQAEKVAAQ